MRTSLLLMWLFAISLSRAQDVASNYDALVPNHYFEFSLKLVKETAGFTPPVAARAFGYMGLTLYESVVPGMPGYLSSQGRLFELNYLTLPSPVAVYHWPTVANNALAEVIDSLFRTTTSANLDSLAVIRKQYNDLYASQVSPQIFEDSKTFGEAIARDVIDYSRLDGGHNGFAQNFPSGYIPPSGPSYWVPYGNQVAMQPYWGDHRPFLEADSALTTISPPHPEFSTDPGSDFYEYAYQVYETGINLTPEQEETGLYWSDGAGTFTPAGHSISMLINILQEEDANLETAAVAYAKLGMALSDAFLACWKSKFIYNLCRPVTYINAHIDSTWVPLIGTPPFPEYPSGHSSQSGAMAAVMNDIFGENYAFIDSSHGANFGGPRSFDHFDEAALEAAHSRLLGGIHFEFGNQAGLVLGDIVGENINAFFNQLAVSTKDLISDKMQITAYPNPASDFVTLTLTQDMIGHSVAAYDMNGRLIYKESIDQEQMVLGIQEWTPGIYKFLVTGNEQATGSLIKY